VRTLLRIEPRTEPLLIINPLVADCVLIEPARDAISCCACGAFAIETRDLVPVSAAERRAFCLPGRGTPAPVKMRPVSKVLESILAELNLGALCDVSYSAPAVVVKQIFSSWSSGTMESENWRSAI